MDDNGITFLCDLLARGETDPSPGSSLPMYLIMVKGGIRFWGPTAIDYSAIPPQLGSTIHSTNRN